MNFLEFINKRTNDHVKALVSEQDQSNTNSDDAKYFDILNPDTGLRYDIPMLSPIDPGYYFKYIYYMKLKEASPETFKKLQTWE